MTHLLVVGDALLDRDLIGEATRLCPDAPVPVLDLHEELVRAGGAALASTVAARAAAPRGERVSLLAAVGRDDAGRTLRRLLEADGVLVGDIGLAGTTPEKVRLRAGGQSLLRFDRGDGAGTGSLDRSARELFEQADVVLVADYGRGVAANEEVRRAVASARSRGVPVVWDPHPLGPEPVEGVTLVTPNAAEARTRCDEERGVGLAHDIRRAHLLRRRWRAAAVAITRGEHGLVAATGDGAPLVVGPEVALAQVDTCGAGDAFAVGVAQVLGSGGLLSDALRRGVDAASDFLVAGGSHRLSRTATGVRRRGPAPSTSTAAEACDRDGRSTVVATGGCFDVLHPGHLALLRAARSLGDHLVVLVNSDASVRRLKGPGRPVHTEGDRVAALRALRDVDEVHVFDDDTPLRALRQLRPDVFVKGGDYTAAALPETAVVAEWGGATVTVPYLPGHSTTRLLGLEEADRVG